MYAGLDYHAEPADVWSCGIVLVALLAGGEKSPNLTKQLIASIFLLLHNYTSIYRFPVLSQFSYNAGCARFLLTGSHII